MYSAVRGGGGYGMTQITLHAVVFVISRSIFLRRAASAAAAAAVNMYRVEHVVVLTLALVGFLVLSVRVSPSLPSLPSFRLSEQLMMTKCRVRVSCLPEASVTCITSRRGTRRET